MNLLFTLCSLNTKTLPLPIVNYLTTNINMKLLDEKYTNWEKIYKFDNILYKYFNPDDYHNLQNKNLNYDKFCHIFTIYGVPAAVAIIKNNNIVTDFVLNKNLILMFDAGPVMRKTFYKKFKYLNIKSSFNKEHFLII